MKGLITNVFCDLEREGRLSMKLSKSKVLIDFILCQPHVSTKACTHDNVMHGFLEGGYIEKKKLRFPDFNKILFTCRRDPTLYEYELWKTSFSSIIKLYLQDGHVCDNIFADLGFPMDIYPIGNQVRREAGIT